MTMLGVDPWRPRPARIARVRRETQDVFTWELDVPRFAFEPGQFNMLYLFGVGEVAISISGDPEGERIEHTIHAVGGVTRAMASLERGDTVGVRGPYGSAWPVHEAEGGDLVLVAGGVGLPPLRPVVHHVLRHRERFGRVFLLYGARSPEDLVYRREVEQWQKREPGLVRCTVDHAGADWRGRVGVAPALVDDVPFDPTRTVAMICGPEVMMRFTVRALRARGVAPERIHLSLERNMKCAIGLCGHCQYVPYFVCRDGPVLRFDRIAWLFDRREV
jgi:NAD(P)H-flavin reductase